jgi:hypothetical protein
MEEDMMANSKKNRKGTGFKQGLTEGFAKGLEKLEGNTSEGNAGSGSGPSSGKPTIGDRDNAYLAGRRSMATDIADAAGGVGPRVANEILYLLPDSFVLFYERLFHLAMKGGDLSSPLGGMAKRQGGLEKAKGLEGMALGSAARLQAMSSGKRWRDAGASSGVNSDIGLKVKQSLDKGLEDLVRDAAAVLKAEADARESGQGDDSFTNEFVGLPRRCGGFKCGKFMKAGWRFCPTCGWDTRDRLLG